MTGPTKERVWSWLVRAGQALAVLVLGALAGAVWYFTDPEDGIAAPRDLTQMAAWSQVVPPKFDLPTELRGLYLSHPLVWEEMAATPGRRCAYGYVTLFYANGDWRRVRMPVCQNAETDAKFDLPFADGLYGTETGHWQAEANGLLVVRIDNCVCGRCAATALRDSSIQQAPKILFPVIEYWTAPGGVIGPAGSSLRGAQETYRVLAKAEIAEEQQFAALWQTRGNHAPAGEPCYIFPEYEVRFRAEKE